MKRILIAIIELYQESLSPETGALPRLLGRNRPTCMFYPSCSAYGKEAIRKHGALKGTLFALRRILSCRPGAKPSLWLVE